MAGRIVFNATSFVKVRRGVNQLGKLFDGSALTRSRAEKAQGLLKETISGLTGLSETLQKQMVLGAPAIIGARKTSSIVTLKMVEVTGGTFMMGSLKGCSDERPLRNVKISTFKLGRFEVTNEEYREYLQATGQDIPKRVADELFSRYPVVFVTWHNAVDYCKWRSEVTGKNVHLPTEAQWEYAARGPKALEYPWGNECDPGKAIIGEAGTAPVDANPEGKSWCGIHDLSGNTWEWTSDWYGPYDPKDLKDPKGPKEGKYKALRGGSWCSLDPLNLRGAYRTYSHPGSENDGIGFRVAED